MTQKCALIMAGGTGGHIFPGLAVAQALLDKGWRVHWLGAPGSMESRIVPARGIPLELVDFGGVRGKGLKTLVLLPFKLLRAFWQSLQVVRRVQPDVLVGLGGGGGIRPTGHDRPEVKGRGPWLAGLVVEFGDFVSLVRPPGGDLGRELAAGRVFDQGAVDAHGGVFPALADVVPGPLGEIGLAVWVPLRHAVGLAAVADRARIQAALRHQV